MASKKAHSAVSSKSKGSKPKGSTKPPASKPAPPKHKPIPGKPVAGKIAPGKPSAKPTVKPPARPEKAATAPHHPAAAQGSAPKGGAAPPGKPVRKGITIVTPKPVRRPREKPSIKLPPMPGAQLLAPGIKRKPLIPSGPKSPAIRPLGAHGPEAEIQKADVKSPLTKKDLAYFRDKLVKKRVELAGDVTTMEKEALNAESGSLSNLPQHMAEQGSETYDQSLSLNLAAADRRLIKEIDDAIGRIDKGTFGLCMLTGKAIKRERLEEIPWARYSIEAARDLERRGIRP